MSRAVSVLNGLVSLILSKDTIALHFSKLIIMFHIHMVTKYFVLYIVFSGYLIDGF